MSPHGRGEWTDLDFQAVMCGCFVIKAGAGAFRAYPNVLEGGELALSVRSDWSDLKDAVQGVLQVRGWQGFTQSGAGQLFHCKATLCARLHMHAAHGNAFVLDTDCTDAAADLILGRLQQSKVIVFVHMLCPFWLADVVFCP